MALLEVTELGQTGFDITDNLSVASATGDQYPNDERTFLVVNNGVVDCNVTISKTRDTADKHGFGSLDVDDITYTVTANTLWVVRVPVASHGDAAGRVTVTYDDESNVTVGAYRLARF